jgi:hypothetical protein
MRRGGAEFTQTKRDEHDELLRREHTRLANPVIKVVGARQIGGKRNLLLGDSSRRECVVVRLTGELKAWNSGEEDRSHSVARNKRVGRAMPTSS